MKIIKVGSCLVLAFFLQSGFAETSVWTVRSNDFNFYIAGSCHVLRKSDYPLPKEFELAYKNAEQIIFETNLDELASPHIQQNIFKLGMYPKNDNLKNHISASTYNKLVKYCQERQLPIDAIIKMRPWMASLSLTSMELQKFGITFDSGVDRYFNQKARQDNKKTAGLVPANEHIKLMTSFSEELNDIVVESVLNDMDQVKDIVDDLIDAWRKGDTKKLEMHVIQNLQTDYPLLYKLILTDRNKRWVNTIEQLISSKKNAMIIVGSAHLVGKDSVLNLLRKKGYTLDKFTINN